MSRSLQEEVVTSRLLIYREVALNSFRSWDGVIGALGLMAALLILLDAGGPVLAPFKLIMCLALPGWVLVSRLADADPAARLVWTVVASAMLFTVFAFFMAWSGIWHPRPVAAAGLVASSAAIVLFPAVHGFGSRPFDWRLRPLRQLIPLDRVRLLGRLRERSLRELLPWLVLGAALIMWGISLAMTGSGDLDTWGLLTKYPATWYLAVAAVLGLCIWGIGTRREIRARFLIASVSGLVVMLYASANLLTAVPRLPWSYKHIAVTDFIGATGQMDPSVDIYNRWPGFFASSAFLGETIGLRDALDYAAWAEIGFALLNVVTVLAIARALSRNPRVYWTATLVFVLANWVNQNYYSPQAFGYTLYLTMCLIVLTFLRSTPIMVVQVLEERLTRPQLPVIESYDRPIGRSLRVTAIVAVLLLQAAIVVSHQLTPYLALLGLVPLFLLGYFRPRWLAPALVVMTLLYLIPNIGFIEQKYGLFTGFDPLANAGYQPRSDTFTDPAAWLMTTRWMARAAVLLSVLTGVLALAGFVRRLMQGEVRTTLMVAWMAVAPAFGLLGQSYGGEARLRIYLFALPWLAIGVAWLFWSGPLRTRKALLGATASLSAMALLFSVVYFQPEEDHRIPQGDVVASQWIDSRARSGDVIFEPGYFFPTLIGPNYPNYYRTIRVAPLSGLIKNLTGPVNAENIEKYADSIKPTSNVYVVISDNKREDESAAKLSPSGTVSNFERDLSFDNRASRVFESETVRIYQIAGTP
ncbi:hypothetical protein [Arthrobacter pascens]|uniref:hypothetical protein n=1 Tax=Arthrobacter pascens TaxID=1677 RepID=UPI00196B750E|nr:hypothetical protein [Arthrobacter pascens]MBN3496707.1 hypothetical protein [Arthrobacter pascens]